MRAVERILQRAQRLQQPAHLPLAIFAPNSSKQKIKFTSLYIFHSQVEKSLQSLANTVYNIKSK